jgi:hypothetical protein
LADPPYGEAIQLVPAQRLGSRKSAGYPAQPIEFAMGIALQTAFLCALFCPPFFNHHWRVTRLLGFFLS